jgi:hypothetical protein
MGSEKQATRVWLMMLCVVIILGLSLTMALETDASLLVAEDQAVRALVTKSKTAFLPIASRMEPQTTLPFADDFGYNMSPDWMVYPFHGEDWKQDKNLDIYWCNYDSAETDRDDWWGMSMYLGPGSERWGDYEVTTVLKSSKAGSVNGGLAGIWLRGSYAPNGTVGGYYVHIKRNTDEVVLWRLRPGAQNLSQADLVRAEEYLPGLGTRWFTMKVRVQGARISVWLKDAEESDSAYRFLFDWTDPNATYMQGTVGLSSYRSRAVYDHIRVVEIPTGGN